MRVRVVLLAACTFLLLWFVPMAHAEGESIRGTLRGPDGTVAGVTVTVESGGDQVGKATTAADGTWQVAVPGPGSYAVVLDASTLPKGLQLRNKGGERLPDVTVTPGQNRTVIFPLVRDGTPQVDPSATATAAPEPAEPEGGGSSSWAQFLQLLVAGIKFGAIIAITSIGLSLVFGTTGLINFAHGELVTIGAMVAFFFSTSPLTLPLVGATLLAVVIGALLGGAMEAGMWRPMRRRGAGLIQLFIMSIGLSLLLRHLILVIFGSRRMQYSEYTIQSSWEWGPISMTPRDLVVTLLCIVVLLGVAYWLLRTRVGKATRAIADNRDLAQASGIDVDRVVMVVWLIGGGLAAFGGVMYGLSEAVYWDMGFNLLLLMFAGVILGGLGSAFGAVVGSFVVGIVAQVSTLWFPVELQYAWALLVLIIVLLVRPQGILGRAQRAG